MNRVVSRLVTRPHGTLLIRHPVGDPGFDASLVMIHGVGESRAGTNYWQAQLAMSLARRGITTICMDLAGYGDNAETMDEAMWDRQLEDAVVVASNHAARVCVTGRGLHAALLDGVSSASLLRIALWPSHQGELGWLEEWQSEHPSSMEVVASEHPGSAELAYWTACGADAAVLGGMRLPSTLLRHLCARLASGASWNAAVVPIGDRRPLGDAMVCGSDQLARLEVDRVGLTHLLGGYLTRWSEGRVVS